MSFGGKIDPWMTPKSLLAPPVHCPRSGSIECALRLAWIMLTGPGKGEIRLVGAVQFLFSPEIDRLSLDSAEDSSSEACASAVTEFGCDLMV